LAKGLEFNMRSDTPFVLGLQPTDWTVLNGELVGDGTMSHVPSHWDSLVDLLQRFNYSSDLPRCGIASCRSSPTKMGNSLN